MDIFFFICSSWTCTNSYYTHCICRLFVLFQLKHSAVRKTSQPFSGSGTLAQTDLWLWWQMLSRDSQQWGHAWKAWCDAMNWGQTAVCLLTSIRSNVCDSFTGKIPPSFKKHFNPFKRHLFYLFKTHPPSIFAFMWKLFISNMLFLFWIMKTDLIDRLMIVFFKTCYTLNHLLPINLFNSRIIISQSSDTWLSTNKSSLWTDCWQYQCFVCRYPKKPEIRLWHGIREGADLCVCRGRQHSSYFYSSQ